MMATPNGSHPHPRAKGELMDRKEEEEDSRVFGVFLLPWNFTLHYELLRNNNNNNKHYSL